MYIYCYDCFLFLSYAINSKYSKDFIFLLSLYQALMHSLFFLTHSLKDLEISEENFSTHHYSQILSKNSKSIVDLYILYSIWKLVDYANIRKSF